MSKHPSNDQVFQWSQEIYSHVAVVGVTAVKFADVKRIVAHRLGKDAAERVHHFREPGDLLATLPSPQTSPSPPVDDVKIIRGRKVTYRLANMSPEQAKLREQMFIGAIAESILKSKKKPIG